MAFLKYRGYSIIKYREKNGTTYDIYYDMGEFLDGDFESIEDCKKCIDKFEDS